jgi:hypothetical protein
VRQEAIPVILRSSRLNCWNRAAHCGLLIGLCPVRTSEGTPAVLNEVFVVDMDMSYARRVHTASLTSYSV